MITLNSMALGATTARSVKAALNSAAAHPMEASRLTGIVSCGGKLKVTAAPSSKPVSTEVAAKLPTEVTSSRPAAVHSAGRFSTITVTMVVPYSLICAGKASSTRGWSAAKKEKEKGTLFAHTSAVHTARSMSTVPGAVPVSSRMTSAKLSICSKPTTVAVTPVGALISKLSTTWKTRRVRPTELATSTGPCCGNTNSSDGTSASKTSKKVIPCRSA
mmetsp:Transcript_29416/g.69955  ORF Transcript_29416/g.69955 Transcript_29416/m.69955 type:complete len:217 (-) Transcript_29416:5071-5721(-)